MIVGCTTTTSDEIETTIQEETEINNHDDNISSTSATEETNPSWKDIPLTDVRTGNTFKINDFAGTPIFLESFAVWCPTCTKQQQILKELHEEIGDEVISISLNTDPNEDKARVQEHITKNNFDWYYAIAPTLMTQGLIDEFGVGVVSAPSAPIILICKDQSTRYLKRGLKSVNDLKEALAEGC